MERRGGARALRATACAARRAPSPRPGARPRAASSPAVRLDREHAAARQRDRPACERQRGAQLLAVAALGQLGDDARRHAAWPRVAPPRRGAARAGRRRGRRRAAAACRPRAGPAAAARERPRRRATAARARRAPRPRSRAPRPPLRRAAGSTPRAVAEIESGGRRLDVHRLNSGAPRPIPAQRVVPVIVRWIAVSTSWPRECSPSSPGRIGSPTISRTRLTPGYKRTVATQHAFGDILLESRRNGAPLGDVGFGVEEAGTRVDLTQGALRMTEEPLDVALDGEGFFAVATANGVRYTRDGQFRVDASGKLVTAVGDTVLGTNGKPIVVGAGVKPAIATDGTVSRRQGRRQARRHAALEPDEGRRRLLHRRRRRRRRRTRPCARATWSSRTPRPPRRWWT